MGETKASPPTADTARITARTGAKRMLFMLSTTVSHSGAYYPTNQNGFFLQTLYASYQAKAAPSPPKSDAKTFESAP